MEFARAYDPIRALQASWKLLGRSPLPLLVAGILLTLFDGGGRLGFEWHDWEHHHRLPVGAVVVFFGLATCFGLVCFLVGSWISLGIANVVEKTVIEGRASPADAFNARGRLFEMVLGQLLAVVIALGACVPFGLIALAAVFSTRALHMNEGLAVVAAILAALAYLPFYLYLILGISLSRQAIAIEGLQPVAALQRSWNLVRGNRLRLLLYWIVIGVFGALGLLLCCVGVFLTSTLEYTAQYESYLALTRPEDYSRSWLAGAPVPPKPPLNATIG